MKKKRKIVYTVILFIGLALMTWTIFIYRNAIISLTVPVAIVFIVSLLAFLLDSENYRQTYDNFTRSSLTYFAVLQFIFSYGFIVCSLFVLTNYYLADTETVKKSYVIIERSTMPGAKRHRSERKPTFCIYYEGVKKELVFSHKFYENRESYTNIELDVHEGYFGIDIIKNKVLK